FVIETHIIEFASLEHLSNRLLAAARETSVWLGGLHAIADLKHLRHGVGPSPPSGARVPVPRMGVPSVYARRRRLSCRETSIVLSGNLPTKAERPRIAPGAPCAEHTCGSV